MSSPEYHLKKKKQYDAQKKAILSAIKVSKGCENCGFVGHPQALTFDHIDPKEKVFGIANYGTISWANLLAEVSKCRVLCANCHNAHSDKQAANGVTSLTVPDRVADLVNQYFPGLIENNIIPGLK